MNRRNGITISDVTWNLEKEGPSCSGILIWLSTDVWDNIVKGHNEHTGNIKDNFILGCDCEKGQVHIWMRKVKNNFERFIEYVIGTSNM